MELLEWGRLFLFSVSKPTKMFVLQMIAWGVKCVKLNFKLIVENLLDKLRKL